MFSIVSANNVIMPVELANPDKILIEGMDTTFYIVIGNEDIKENVVQLEISFFNEDEKKITIPYYGENIVEVPFKIPLLISQNKMMPVSIKGFNKDKYQEWKLKQYFLLQTSFNIYKKYPTSILPSLVSEKYNNLVMEKEA